MAFGSCHVLFLLVLLSSTCWMGCSSTLSQHGGVDSYYHRALPIVEPDSGHTKLILAKEGLDAISRLETPIAAVAVIGPYRSGKSFLLNQLLSLSCEEGFGVGHMRDTKTKGIWVWGKPIEMDIGGVKTSILFLDTEGFESVGKSNVYDDRIFALATIMSSVLIYNLPETIREADISRLSFAVELAQEFYGRVKGRDIAFQPAKLLWLIQRDFLEGKTVQQMVNEALQQVPNLTGNKNIEQVNQIRESLEIMGENSTAFSLPQPHLMRTKLCNLHDSDLDQSYIKRREELKGLVTSMIQPKMVRGKFLSGKEFVSFLQQILEALNKGDIPSTVSLVEIFNRGVVDQCLKLYNDMMLSVSFPLSEDLLRQVHEESKLKVMAVFEEQRFGRHHAKTSVERLESEIQKVYANLYLRNEYKSAKLCEGLYTSCGDKVDELQELRLPSMAKFNAGFAQCNRSFTTVADPYEVAVLSLPTSVTDRLLRIFRQGLATRYDIDIQCLTSLRELPEVTAVAILEQFATNNFADGRNKGAYLAGLIARYKVDSLASGRIPMLHQGQSSDLPSRDAGLLGLTGTNNSSLLNPLVASRPLPGSALLRHDPYATATSLGSFSQVPPLLTGDSRIPTRLDDVHSLSSYRAPASTGFNMGSSLPETSVGERRPPIKFDPFTGQPFKFDPFTGEPIQQPGPVSLPSSHFTGKYY